MANKEFPLPILGVNYGLPVDKTPQSNSGYMNNVFPRDTLERRIRLGQRPGMDKLYSQQIGGVDNPIIAVIQITTVD